MHALRLARLRTVVAALLIAPFAFASAALAASEVTGSVTYRDRALLPPDAVLTVTLSDISLMDVAATVIAERQYTDLGAPPYAFALPYDPAAITEGHTYAVRATVTSGERLVMTTDTVHPVLTNGAGQTADMTMIRISGSEGDDTLAPMQTALGLTLPATYTGTLPGASGAIDWHLDLWPDQVFHLSQTFEEGTTADIGRWSADPARNAIVLRGGREAPIFLETRGNGDLRLMDTDGNQIDSDLKYTLTAGPLAPASVSLPMRGAFRYAADVAIFQECLTGRDYPVEFEGDYLALEQRYLDTRVDPFEPILAVLDGTLEMRPAMEGPDTVHLIVDRFSRLAPDDTCERAMATATLTNTYWRLLELGGAELATAEGQREPYLILRTGDTPSFNATVGCNMLRGGYEMEGATLSFGNAAMTLMACPPPLDADERALGQALAAAAKWQINGTTLEVFDADGTLILMGEAVYLP